MSLLDRDEVPGLDQADRQPAGDRVQRDPGAYHATADDQHVVLAAGERAQRRRALGRPQPRRPRPRDRPGVPGPPGPSSHTPNLPGPGDNHLNALELLEV